MSIKPWKELTIADDYMFKRVMSNKEICKKMLEKILQVKIHDIKYLEEEKVLQPSYENKGIRLDVYVEDDKNTVYDVEMQVSNPGVDELAARVRYYQAMIDVEHLSKGEPYTKINETFIIFICLFDPFGSGRHCYPFHSWCDVEKDLKLPEKITKVFLNTKGTKDDVLEDVQAFLHYIAGHLSEDAFVQTVHEEVKALRRSKWERANYMFFEEKLQAERNKGFVEGEKKGLAEGEKKTEVRMQKLINKLAMAKRFDDLADMADSTKLKALYAEFDI